MSTTNPLRTFFARRSDSAQDNSITTNLPVGFLDCVRLNALLVGMLLDWGVLVYDVAEDNLWRERVARKKMRENKEKKKEGGGDEDYFAATMAAEEAGEAANLNPTPPPSSFQQSAIVASCNSNPFISRAIPTEILNSSTAYLRHKATINAEAGNVSGGERAEQGGGLDEDEK